MTLCLKRVLTPTGANRLPIPTALGTAVPMNHWPGHAMATLHLIRGEGISRHTINVTVPLRTDMSPDKAVEWSCARSRRKALDRRASPCGARPSSTLPHSFPPQTIVCPAMSTGLEPQWETRPSNMAKFEHRCDPTGRRSWVPSPDTDTFPLPTFDENGPPVVPNVQRPLARSDRRESRRRRPAEDDPFKRKSSKISILSSFIRKRVFGACARARVSVRKLRVALT